MTFHVVFGTKEFDGHAQKYFVMDEFGAKQHARHKSIGMVVHWNGRPLEWSSIGMVVHRLECRQKTNHKILYCLCRCQQFRVGSSFDVVGKGKAVLAGKSFCVVIVVVLTDFSFVGFPNQTKPFPLNLIPIRMQIKDARELHCSRIFQYPGALCCSSDPSL